jgi:hypothetical protein
MITMITFLAGLQAGPRRGVQGRFSKPGIDARNTGGMAL